MKIGDRIDDYTLLYECGKGGFGIVFLAQNDDGRYVAFKAVTLLSHARTNSPTTAIPSPSAIFLPSQQTESAQSFTAADATSTR